MWSSLLCKWKLQWLTRIGQIWGLLQGMQFSQLSEASLNPL